MPQGDYNHIEIPADDTKRARAFYEGLFGWTFTETPFGDYLTYRTPVGDAGVGGGMGKRGETAPMTIRNYVGVDSIDDSVTKATELGGRVIAEKDEIPGIGWWAVLSDTEGNELGIFQPMPRAEG
jgi:predicted enzyme related to lactoylglutathione lyase